MYDAIVVGARCAGSPTALLLARAGLRVLLVDKARFPSDIMSTHFLHTWGIARLKRWGVLDDVIASGCPPITKVRFDLGRFAIDNPVAGDGFTATYCPRRTVLDTILVRAAVAAGAELREGFSVKELVYEDGAVVGIRGSTKGGEVTERARIVIGADGRHSVVARSVRAPRYNDRGVLACGYYAYWSGVPLDGVEIYLRDHRGILLFPTNADRTCIGMEWPREEFHAFRADIEGNFYKTLALVPDLEARVRAGRREERFIGQESPNFFRKPYGRGWALAGDAGYYKDPVTGTGISDAFRDAELLAEAVVEGLGGRRALPSAETEGAPRTLEQALSGYELQRNQAAMPLYEQTVALAMLPPAAQALRMFAAQAGAAQAPPAGSDRAEAAE